MPRSGAQVMVRLAESGRCNATRVVPAAGDAAAAGGDGRVCVGAMLAQEAAPRDVFAAAQPRGAYKFRVLVMQLQVRGVPTRERPRPERA